MKGKEAGFSFDFPSGIGRSFNIGMSCIPAPVVSHFALLLTSSEEFDRFLFVRFVFFVFSRLGAIVGHHFIGSVSARCNKSFTSSQVSVSLSAIFIVSGYNCSSSLSMAPLVFVGHVCFLTITVSCSLWTYPESCFFVGSTFHFFFDLEFLFNLSFHDFCLLLKISVKL